MRRALLITCVAIFAAAVIHATLHAWLTDDVFITMRYADHVLAGHGPVYNPGERIEGYTHFLWFLLLTLGRAVGTPAHLLGLYLSIPAYLGSLLLLVRISGRLFPGRGGLAGIPAAALAWALHEDARWYASGGLETALFTCLLLLGFHCLLTSRHRRRHQLAGMAYALATLTRPDGAMFSAWAGLYLLWQRRSQPHGVREFLTVWLLLIAPQVVFRLAYYRDLLPNTFYAKAGDLSYWSQGVWYLASYFMVYVVLVAAFASLPFILRDLRRSSEPALTPAREAAPALVLLLVSALASIVSVTRMGGDYMFARFFVPVTPFLLLLCESIVQRPARPLWRAVGAIVLLAGIGAGSLIKPIFFSDGRHWHGIADEPQVYSVPRFERFRTQGEALQRCLADKDATLLVQGGQATLAYYARFPIAIEVYGLTDRHIAQLPLRQRARPGHEKFIDAEYAYERQVNFRFHYRDLRNAPRYARLAFEGPQGWIHGEILCYERELMDELKQCPGIRFLDFPLWLEQTYIPAIAREAPQRLQEDFAHFTRYYFNHNPDREGLQQRLRAALAARGITRIETRPLQPLEDGGVR